MYIWYKAWLGGTGTSARQLTRKFWYMYIHVGTRLLENGDTNYLKGGYGCLRVYGIKCSPSGALCHFISPVLHTCICIHKYM